MPAELTNKINPDIAKERQKASFDVEEFACWYNGGAQKLKEQREIVEEVFSYPGLIEDIPSDYLSYRDQYDEGIKRSVLLMNKLKEMQNKRNPGGNDIFPNNLNGAIGYAILPQGTPFLPHFLMFIPTIEKQGTSAQVEKWLPLAKNCKIFGTYAQTELSHGTFIRGIQTRADYDPVKEEFILNSPSITAYKWWPGALGHTVNYTILVAQLYIKDKHHGIQFFIVQLRDEETHIPLPGIHIGDIGNKLGLKGINNGYLGFKNVRIPRMQMLMRYAQVDADGTFTSSPMAILGYWTMVSVRVAIVKQASFFLTLAATIATRYAAVRRQGLINPKEPEHQILDHLTQQLKLFPEISKGIAYKLGAESLLEMFSQVTKEIADGKFNRLAEIHALSACLKAITSSESATGIETLRLACGGHGYAMASSLPGIYSFTTAAATYEGENTVLLLQTARFLMKAWSMAVKGEKLQPTVAYIEEAVGMSRGFSKWNGSLECMVKALQFTATNKIGIAYNHMSERKKNGMTPEEAANATSIELAQAADLHGRCFLAATAWQKLVEIYPDGSLELQRVLLDVLELYLVNECFRNIGDILRFINLTEEDLSGLETKLEQVLNRLRPNAVAIVDGFDYHDRLLNSVLGSFDGNAYERIFDAAQKSPLNKIAVQKSFHTYLKPFMKSNM